MITLKPWIRALVILLALTLSALILLYRHIPSSLSSPDPPRMSGAARLKHLKIAPKEAHKATIIFLHGLGDSGHGWTPVAKMLYPSLPHVKWIIPHAPEIPITINGGMRMPGWFDIFTLDKVLNSRHDDEPGILSSIASIDALVQAEVDAGVPEDKIVVGGFSQGGAIAAMYGLTSGRNLGGVVALSTWVLLNHKVQEMTKANAKDIPLFWGHGTDDPVVQYQYGKASVDLLSGKLGFPLVGAGAKFQRPGLRFESYPGLGHSSSAREIEDLRGWLQEALKI